MFQLDPQDKYILMRKDAEVCSFTFNLRRRTIGDLTVMSENDAPWGASVVESGLDATQLAWWISYRYIPTGRNGLSAILRGAGCADPASLLFKSLALNLSDQYWIRPEGLDVSWGDVNYFENPYVDGRPDWTTLDGVHVRMGPGSATSGQLAKRWECRGSTCGANSPTGAAAIKNVLVKGSSSNDCHEPWAELLTSELCRALLPEGSWVPYWVEEDSSGQPVSVCECFVDENTEFVALDDVVRHFDAPVDSNLHDAYVDILERLGVADARAAVDRELVLDFLTANDDRHEFNLGILLDSDSRTPLRVAPVFDNGRAFFPGAHTKSQLTEAVLPYDARVFDNGAAGPLALVRDLSWIDFDALRAFAPTVGDILSRTQHPAWFAPATQRQFLLRVDALERAAIDGVKGNTETIRPGAARANLYRAVEESEDDFLAGRTANARDSIRRMGERHNL